MASLHHVLAVALLAAATVPGQSRPAPKGRTVLSTCELRGVTIDDGPLRQQIDEARAFYLRIPDDDLLKGFRARAGRPAPGADLGGWYSSDTFHVFGQIVSGLARLHAATGDPACREKVMALVRGFSECIATDGYGYASSRPNAPHYTYDKLVGGLVDAQLYCGDGVAPEALRRITDQAERHLARDRKPGDTSTEWYTLTENLLRAYLATGEERYRTFAAVWEYPQWWSLFPERRDLFVPPAPLRAYHAYSHVNTLGGAGASWLVTGESKHLAILTAAHDELGSRHTFATGGFGPDEQLLPLAELHQRLLTTHHSFETQCGTWAVFKLCKYLLRATGDARYGDWIERLAINALSASLPNTADGRVFYYSDYHPTGGSKFVHATGWTCCSGTRPMALADLCDLVWLTAADQVCVNLFVPSTLSWQPEGAPVTLRMRTRFPERDTVELQVGTAAPRAFTLRFRTPAWLAAPLRATINGAPAEVTAGDRHWASLARTWADGDRVVVTLPMQLAAVPLPGDRPLPAAMVFGPVVLAARAGSKSPHEAIDPARLLHDLVPSADEPLTWHARSDPAALIRPFFAFREGERYVMYLDPALARRIPHEAVAFQGAWQHGGRFRYCDVPGATAECSFTGTGVRWLGFRFDDAGKAEVEIDGKVITVVDQFGPGRDLPFDWKWDGLAPGEHRLRLRLLPEKAAASKGRFLNVAGFEGLGGR